MRLRPPPDDTQPEPTSEGSSAGGTWLSEATTISILGLALLVLSGILGWSLERAGLTSHPLGHFFPGALLFLLFGPAVHLAVLRPARREFRRREEELRETIRVLRESEARYRDALEKASVQAGPSDEEAAGRLAAAARSHSAQSAHLVSVQEEERRFLARELHDGLGQTLTALIYGLRRSAQRSRVELPEVAEGLLELSKDVESAILDVRDLSRRLRPAALELGVVAAIESEVAMFTRKTAIRCVLDAPAQPIPVDLDRALVLFRVAQEALANVARHAHATDVSIRINHESGNIRLVVADNGDGFSAGATSLGLTGLAERLSPFGGWLRLEQNEPRGARLVASIAVSPPRTTPPPGVTGT